MVIEKKNYDSNGITQFVYYNEQGLFHREKTITKKGILYSDIIYCFESHVNLVYNQYGNIGFIGTRKHHDNNGCSIMINY